MSNNRSELFYAGASASPIDPSLPNRHISVPAEVSSYDWSAIVGANAAHWATQCKGVNFYWNTETIPSIVVVGNDAQVSETELTDAVTFVNNIFTDKKLIEQYANSTFPHQHQIPAEKSATAPTTGRHHHESHPHPHHPHHHHGGQVYQQSFHGHNHGGHRHFHNNVGGGRYMNNYRRHHGNHQRHNPNQVSEQHQIPDDHVGLVIGTKGATIKAIKDVSGANIQIDKVPNGSGNRSMMITGTPEQIQRAKLEIDRVVENQSLEATTEDQKVSEMITIPSTVVGTVIGRQGETIRLLQMLTHCTILMQKDNDVQVGATTRNIQLLGTDQQIEAAKEQIQKLVQAQSKATFDKPVDANLVLTGRASHRSLDIRVSSDIIGMIIGKGGENIRRVNEKSGAKINVDKDTNNPIRTINIVAHNDASLRTAEQLLREIIIDCNHRKNKNGGVFPPPHAFDPHGSNMMPNHYPMFPANPSGNGFPPPQPLVFIPPQSQYLPPGGVPPANSLVHISGNQRNAPPVGGALPSGIVPVPFPGPATPGSGVPSTEPAPPSGQQLSVEDQDLYEYYYTFYLKSYPADKAAQFAKYYVENPPQSGPIPNKQQQ